MSSTMRKSEHIAKLVEDLEQAELDLVAAKKDESMARQNTVAHINSVNHLKKKIKEAMDDLNLTEEVR